MTAMRRLAAGLLGCIVSAALLADVLAPAGYDDQFREFPNEPPSHRFPLGTDALGRDRLSRLLHGTRVSLLLAPAAAMVSTGLAALVGGAAGYLGGRWDVLLLGGVDLLLSLPTLFVLLTARGALPLDASPHVSVFVTFLLLGALGWAPAARVIRAGVKDLRQSPFLLQARAMGCGPAALFRRQVLPNVRPLLQSQFLLAVPLYILSEANLGLLGLGVAEPLPSWGTMLRELEAYGVWRRAPWVLAPAAVLTVTVGCLFLILPPREELL